MNFKRLLFLCLLLWATHAGVAQVIKGTVIDAQTRTPLPFANVFLNQTTKGTTTDARGEFILKLLHEPGAYELVVSFVGYESYKASITISENELMSADIALRPEEKELSNVTVQGTRDKNWEKQLKRFEKVFLGEDELADSCKILNPWVIDFVQDKAGKLQAFADEPIEIENRGLGYKLQFFLRFFWVDRTGYFIAGNVKFSEQPSMDEQQMLEWQVNRKISYLRSRHHLFKSMVEHRINGEGFRLYTEDKAGAGAVIRSANFGDDLNKVVFPYDTSALVAPDKDGNFRITLDGKIEVHYQPLKAAFRTYRDVAYPVSWIQFRSKSIVVNKEGYEVNPSDVTVSGDMSTDRVSRMLPLDYQPTNIVTLKDMQGDFLSQFREKIYVHTNKPYYYPGEPIWFKGYINYSTPGWRDSLSRTVYTELINPHQELTLSKTLEISNGFFHNDFLLPDSLAAGTYYLRAYTNFNRNFGDSSLFVRPIPILGSRDKADPDQKLGTLEEDTTFIVFTDKRKYKPREKITLTIQSMADDGLPTSANLSLSVTDDQVIAVHEPLSITKDFPFGAGERFRNKELSFPIEYGVGFSGRFVNDAGKPEMTILNGIQFEPQNLFFAQSDEKGIFTVKELHFYDSAEFAIKSEKATTKPYGKVELLKRQPAAMAFAKSDYKVNILPIKGQKRTISEYEMPRDARMLSEVEIKATRLVVESTDRVRRPYGKPDYVLKPKDFNKGYGNVLLALPGKVPGLIVRESNNDGQETRWVVYLQRASSIANPPEVIVTINDNFVSGNPAQILSALDPNAIESIEVKKGVNVLYGSYGGGGIVSVYTKQGLESSEEKLPPNFQKLKVPGYSPTHQFRFPNYSDPELDASLPDFRSTIYWNPNIETDPKTGIAEVSFYAADIPGGYRIVAEGITAAGEPKRTEYFIQVER